MTNLFLLIIAICSIIEVFLHFYSLLRIQSLHTRMLTIADVILNQAKTGLESVKQSLDAILPPNDPPSEKENGQKYEGEA